MASTDKPNPKTPKAGGDVDQALAAYERFLARRRDLEDGARRGYQTIDQIILSGAAGTLALSITFLTDIGPATRFTRWLVFGGWLLLLITLGLALWSHRSSSRAFEAAIDQLDREYTSGRRDPDWKNRHDQLTRRLNGIMMAGFVAGIALLALFAFVTLPTTGSSDDRAATQADTLRADAPAADPAGARGRTGPASAATSQDPADPQVRAEP
ncbi:MAG: hypothetical protein AB7I33_00550 [Gemmatimonadales bacterium]